ncbi:MAG: NAD(P)H-dependent glycerol-3-phosphate dehydrogenase [Polyangiaceae bacterium]|nr:NAD(P)H-dependent glycerol-3-phosphate dehydrogenase [Polyangiaceae bacterium]
MSHTAILGAGAWGTALSLVLSGRGESVRLWTHDEFHAEELRRERENVSFFAGFRLPDAVQPTSELAAAVEGATLVIIVVPTHAYRETLRAMRPSLADAATLVTATKGIEPETLMLLSEVVEDQLGSEVARRSVTLSGPSFAKEVALGMPTNVVAAGIDAGVVGAAQTRMATERFRIYASDDPVGVQVGGALKNVIAIAAGACEGLGFGHNTRAALITRGLAEMSRLAVAKGGNVLSLAGLAGLGDLVLTCTGELSRNRTVGFEVGRGRPLGEVLSGLGHVAEGVDTARSAYLLAERLAVELPISSEVYRVLFEGKSASDAVRDVIKRPLRREWP